jgi:hypothetical protein
MTVRVVFHGVKRRTGEMMIDLYRGYDPILKKGVEVAAGKEIEGGISEEFFAELRADYPGAFELVNTVAAPKPKPAVVVKAVPDNGVPPVVKAQPVVRGEMPILFANGIGNAVLLTPAFRGLAEKRI